MALQGRRFDESPYERPNRGWVCGSAAQGVSCALGPGRLGSCRAGPECHPYRRGDRFVCARVAWRGGRCPAGPGPEGACGSRIPPCVPRRSLRGRRGQISRWSSALLLAGLVAVFAGSGREDALSPGPLSYAHGTSVDDCGGCHAAAHEASFGLLGAGSASQSDLCLGCHELGPDPLAPHGLEPARLRAAGPGEASGGRPSPSLRMAALFPGGAGAREQLACAACHPEHGGRAAALAELSDDQCQICHSRRFESFTRGHPPFEAYPYARAARLRFGHERHRAQHFAQVDRPFRCMECHQLEGSGRFMLSASFETGCAECHGEDVRAEGLRARSRGLALLRLPALRPDPAGRATGEWPDPPRRRRRDADASAFLELLIQSELGDAARAATDAERAWAIKRLLHGLLDEGQAGLGTRLERVTGRPLSRQARSDLVGGFSFEVLAEATALWFPSLDRELSARADHAASASGTERATAPPAETRPRRPRDGAAEDWAEHGGWFVQAEDLSIRYRPRGHADPLLRSWIDLAADLVQRDGGDRSVYDELAGSRSPGACLKCHSAEWDEQREHRTAPQAGADADAGQEGARLRVNWRGFRPSAAAHPSTRFVHRPHFSLADPKRCGVCHLLREREVEEQPGFDPYHGFTSDFEPMSAESCASCHTGTAARDACTTCHDYHLADFVPLYLSATVEPPPTP